MAEKKSKVIWVPYTHVSTKQAIATGATPTLDFDVNEDFLIDDIRSEISLNGAVAGSGQAGAPLAIDASPSANNNLIPFKNQVGLLFSLGGEQLASASCPSTLISSDARRPSYPPTPRLITRRAKFSCAVTNSSGQTIDVTLALVGRRRRVVNS